MLHQSVVNPNKAGRLRVVYDAGSQYWNTSLNKNLIKGPDFFNNIVRAFIQFRKGKIAAASDIQEMFHQIRVWKSDQDALRFCWGEYQLKPIEDYVICVHVFKKLYSSCVANYTLRKTAIDQKAKYHNIVDAVHKKFYIDDYLGSYRNKDLVKETAVNVARLLSEGEFRLTKWISISNSFQVLPQSEIAKSSIKYISLKNETDKKY